MMRLTASDFYTFYRPAACDLRVFLKYSRAEEAPPSPYEEVIRRLGKRHEKEHLLSLPPAVDLSSLALDERTARTAEAMTMKAHVIYQAAFRATKTLNGVACEIVGNPDFLILADNGQYLIRDSKLSRRITEEDHPEILCQLGIYGWLFEQTTGKSPVALQVHNGTGDVVAVEYDGGKEALAALSHIVSIQQEATQPYSPVGWSKCGTCGYKNICWTQAEECRDVALLVGVDQGLARALREIGVKTVKDLISAFDEERLSQFQRPWGQRTQRVGKKASAILRMAQAMDSGNELLIEPVAVPDHANYVMFDLEGLPPQFDELGKIYLWGMQVFGNKPSKYLAAVAGFGDDGDLQGWKDCLTKAGHILRENGDIPFVHWANYEKTHLDEYVERFGDPDGIAARVRANLLDLLPITQKAIALPLPSYSLKVIEKYVGFKRTQVEYGGDWSMAKYIEATETSDEKTRNEVMGEILTYNAEDLTATWAVLQWLKSKMLK
jgi:predicted RecB family nuclease